MPTVALCEEVNHILLHFGDTFEMTEGSQVASTPGHIAEADVNHV